MEVSWDGLQLSKPSGRQQNILDAVLCAIPHWGETSKTKVTLHGQ